MPMVKAMAVIESRSAERLQVDAPIRRQIVERAAAFIRQRYRMDPTAAEMLTALPVRWRQGAGRSAFYRRPCRGYDGPHILLRVPPAAFARWHTYRRMRARWATPRHGVELPIDVLMTVVLIHEYTHAVQHGVCGGVARRYSEVETTENEIEFVRLHAPAAYAALVPMSTARSRRRPARSTILRQMVNGIAEVFRIEPKPRQTTGARGMALRMLRGILVRYQVARGG
jgi:hypothetical protein